MKRFVAVVFGVPSWDGVSGELLYSDLNGDRWRTRFKIAFGEGNQLYAEHEQPELATA